MVPQDAPVHPVPERLQVTAVFVVPLTVAENEQDSPILQLAAGGKIETETVGGGSLFPPSELQQLKAATAPNAINRRTHL
jgi:hypothetical protein